MPNAIELLRNAEFARNPMLQDFIGCALQDLQYRENDEACTEGRTARDSGTIYEIEGITFVRLTALCDRFAVECAEHIQAALDMEAGDFEYRRGKGAMSHDELGSTLWLAITGSGVTFTDDGNAPCLEAMAEWARNVYCEGLQFGDDESIYLLA